MLRTILSFSLLLIISIAVFALPQRRKTKKVKQSETITKVEYESFTRGRRIEIVINKDSAMSISKAGNKFIVMSAAKWNEITSALNKVKLSAIPLWPSPTYAREYDGAAHSKITVSTKRNKYESQYFDGGKPMQQLQALYDVIENIRNDIEEVSTKQVE